MEITAAFAVPVCHARVEPCDRLNRELEALFLARETQEYRNPAPSHNPQAEMFESRFDLFTWPETCIQELRTFILTNFGFGDFVFRVPDGTEVGRFADLRAMVEMLARVPESSIALRMASASRRPVRHSAAIR